jgi:AraC-like DNA-binding protein
MSAIAESSHDSVSSGLVRAIQRGLAASGLERREFCALTSIREDELDGNARIDAWRYSHVQDLLRQFLSEGMPLGRPSMSNLLDDVPHLASLWCNSPTLAAALQHYCEYRALLGTPDLMSAQVHGDEFELCYVPERRGGNGAIGCDSAVGNFALIMSIVDHYREEVLADLPLHSCVTVYGASRTALSQIEHALGQSCRIENGEPVHRMVMRGAGLWHPTQGFNAALYAHSRRVLEHDMRELQRLPPLATRVCATLDAMWAQLGEPAAPSGLLLRVAEHLNMSRWTLRRRLEEEGFAFQRLVDDLRTRSLNALLSDPGLTMFEISQRLGFDSQSSFSRFVRTRFNETPSQARERLRGQDID